MVQLYSMVLENVCTVLNKEIVEHIVHIDSDTAAVSFRVVVSAVTNVNMTTNQKEMILNNSYRHTVQRHRDTTPHTISLHTATSQLAISMSNLLNYASMHHVSSYMTRS